MVRIVTSLLWLKVRAWGESSRVYAWLAMALGGAVCIAFSVAVAPILVIVAVHGILSAILFQFSAIFFSIIGACTYAGKFLSKKVALQGKLLYAEKFLYAGKLLYRIAASKFCCRSLGIEPLDRNRFCCRLLKWSWECLQGTSLLACFNFYAFLALERCMGSL